jgi:HK97 family phage major capsid protein
MDEIAEGSSPIVFGDFNQAYRIYDRIALAVLRDPYTMAKKSLVRFHARRRVGGDVVKPEAIRKLKMAAA